MAASTRARRIVAAAIGVLSLVALTACTGQATPAAPTSGASSSGLISADRCAKNRAAGTVTFLTSFAYAASTGILDPVVAVQRGYFKDLCLDVRIQPGSSNAQLVSAGKAQLAGLGSASDVMTAAAAGARITGIATYGNTPAITLMSLTSSGITSLRGFSGKTIGYKDAIPPQIEAMLQNAGATGVKWVSVGYDPVILAQKKVDGLTAYISNEPHALAVKGVKVTQWDPGSYGIRSTFNTQVVNTAWGTAHPTAVEDFLRASMHAYQWINASSAHLDTAIGYAAALSTAGYDKPGSVFRWKAEVGLITKSQPAGTGVGQQSVAQWTPEAQALVKYKILKAAPSIAGDLTTTYIDAIYHDGTLVWPAG